MALRSRHRRHLEAVRNTLGGLPAVEALAVALLDRECIWTELPDLEASRVAAHTRSLLLLGAVRMSSPSEEELLHVERLELTLLQSVLNGSLPALGEVGERVRARMAARGPVAVNAHLVQELAVVHGAGLVVSTAGALRDQVFALDALVCETLQLEENGPELLADKAEALQNRMVAELAPAAEVLGWPALQALWLSLLGQLGGGSQDLTSTKAYTMQDIELVQAFSLIG